MQMIAAQHDAEGECRRSPALPKLVATFVTLISIDDHTAPSSARGCVRDWWLFVCVCVG